MCVCVRERQREEERERWVKELSVPLYRSDMSTDKERKCTYLRDPDFALVIARQSRVLSSSWIKGSLVIDTLHGLVDGGEVGGSATAFGGRRACLGGDSRKGIDANGPGNKQ